MPHWTLDQIPWHAFDASKVTPQMASLAKAACLVEYNSYDYARYLCEVFPDDAEFQEAARVWAEEEVQHGQALRKWAELADPTFDFDKSFDTFVTGYKLPTNVNGSVRGSRCGELIARCVVETGTSSYYTALANATDEPVFKAICLKIAADEFRHYKLFYDHLKRYQEIDQLGKFKRLAIALSRIAESEDDELAYAFYAAHLKDGGAYDHKVYKDRYMKLAYGVYRKENIERMAAMVLKAAGIKPRPMIQNFFTKLAWGALQMRAARI